MDFLVTVYPSDDHLTRLLYNLKKNLFSFMSVSLFYYILIYTQKCIDPSSVLSLMSNTLVSRNFL